MSAMTDAGRRGSRAGRAAARCAHRSGAARAHGGRGPAGLCGAVDPLRRHRQGQPGHSRRHVRAVRARAGAGARLPQASAAGDGGRARLVRGLSRRRLGLLPAGHGECRRSRCGSPGGSTALLSRRRKARPGAGAAHAGAVLQFSRAQVQLQHDAHAAVGGDHALVPALVRDPAHRSMRRSPGWARRWRCTANTGRSSCCSGLAWRRCADPGARPISARPPLGDDRWSVRPRSRRMLALADRQRFRCRSPMRPPCTARPRRIHSARRAGLCRRQHRLCRDSADHRTCRGAAGPRHRQGHGVAGRRPSAGWRRRRSGPCCWRRPWSRRSPASA